MHYLFKQYFRLKSDYIIVKTHFTEYVSVILRISRFAILMFPFFQQVIVISFIRDLFNKIYFCVFERLLNICVKIFNYPEINVF